jgi:hypothetical protein
MMPVRADTRRQRTGRGLTGLDLPFSGNKTGNGLRNFHENGLVRGVGGTTRTERARLRRREGEKRVPQGLSAPRELY